MAHPDKNSQERNTIHYCYWFSSSYYWNEADKWVKKSHPNAARVNNLILKRLSEATDKTLEMEMQNASVSVKAIQQKIKPKVGEPFLPRRKLTSMI